MNNEFDFYNGFSVGYKIFDKSEIGNWNSLSSPDPDPTPPPSTPKGVQFACGTSYINGKRVIGAYFDGNDLCARRGIEDPEIEEPTTPDVNDIGRLSLTIDTRKISSSNKTFVLSFRKTINLRLFTISWGDGTTERTDNFIEALLSSSIDHDYPKPGKYTITIESRGLLGLQYEGINTFGKCILSIDFPDDVWLWGADFQGAFTDCTNLRTIDWPSAEPFGFNFGSAISVLFGATIFSFDRSFMNCTSLTFFDFIDTSSALSFNMTWANCTSLTVLPNLDYSKASGLRGTFANSALKSWDCIGTLNANSFENAWFGCQRLVDFPAGKFDSAGNNRLSTNAFKGTFQGCALSAQSIRNILQSLVNNGSRNVTLSLDGGTNAGKSTWDTFTKKRYNTLVKRGWKISFNP